MENNNLEKRKEYKHKYYQAHKEEILEKAKEYRQAYKDKIFEYQKKYRQSHKEEISKRRKKHYQTHKEEEKKYRKEYCQTHKEEMKKYYQTHKEELKKWSKKYWQIHKDKLKQHRKTTMGIYSIIKSSARRRHIEFLISKEDFVNWWNNQEHKCFYCGITEKELSKIDSKINHNTHRLTIDRLDNNKGYTLDNIVLACYQCNYIKGYFFTSDEMKQIALLFVRPKWEEQLK